MWGSTLTGQGIGLFGSLFGAHQQNKANKAALQFQREQAQNAWVNSEIDRRANYDQWAAQQRRRASAFQVMGYGGYEIPTYQPTVDPRFDPNASRVGQAELRRRYPPPSPMSVGSYLR